jgi:DNA (cytosine-5)-methyltransferase 1
MRFGSVCSGIEAASVAWHPLGWEAAWLSEIEPFPCAVLKHHYPDVPNHGDMSLLPEKILSGQVEAPDLFCGGTPCQAFSVAGLRNSLDVLPWLSLSVMNLSL